MRRAADNTPDGGVLVVCTGNICRSPAGERLLRHSWPAVLTVTSAGTYGVVGHPVEPSMARLLQGDGVDVSGFAARRLTEGMIAAADLVLTMETGHRTAVVQAHPQALTRTFTLREFAHLLEVCRGDPSAGSVQHPRDDHRRAHPGDELDQPTRGLRLPEEATREPPVRHPDEDCGPIGRPRGQCAEQRPPPPPVPREHQHGEDEVELHLQ